MFIEGAWAKYDKKKMFCDNAVLEAAVCENIFGTLLIRNKEKFNCFSSRDAHLY